MIFVLFFFGNVVGDRMLEEIVMVDISYLPLFIFASECFPYLSVSSPTPPLPSAPSLSPNQPTNSLPLPKKQEHTQKASSPAQKSHLASPSQSKNASIAHDTKPSGATRLARRCWCRRMGFWAGRLRRGGLMGKRKRKRYEGVGKRG